METRIYIVINTNNNKYGNFYSITCVYTIKNNLEPNNFDQYCIHYYLKKWEKFILVIKDDITTIIQNKLLTTVEFNM